MLLNLHFFVLFYLARPNSAAYLTSFQIYEQFIEGTRVYGRCWLEAIAPIKLWCREHKLSTKEIEYGALGLMNCFLDKFNGSTVECNTMEVYECDALNETVLQVPEAFCFRWEADEFPKILEDYSDPSLVRDSYESVALAFKNLLAYVKRTFARIENIVSPSIYSLYNKTVRLVRYNFPLVLELPKIVLTDISSECDLTVPYNRTKNSVGNIAWFMSFLTLLWGLHISRFLGNLHKFNITNLLIPLLFAINFAVEKSVIFYSLNNCPLVGSKPLKFLMDRQFACRLLFASVAVGIGIVEVLRCLVKNIVHQASFVPIEEDALAIEDRSRR